MRARLGLVGPLCGARIAEDHRRTPRVIPLNSPHFPQIFFSFASLYVKVNVSIASLSLLFISKSLCLSVCFVSNFASTEFSPMFVIKAVVKFFFSKVIRQFTQ